MYWPKKSLWKFNYNFTLFFGPENGTESAETAILVIWNEVILWIIRYAVILRINMWSMESFYLPDEDFSITMIVFDLIWPPWKCNFVIFDETPIFEKKIFTCMVSRLYILMNWLNPKVQEEHVYGF